MTRKVLLVDYGLCIGCETCQGVCAFVHGGRPNVVIHYAPGGLPIPIVCRHCEDAPCIAACPVKAIYRDEEGAVIIDHEKCIRCQKCVTICPYNAPRFDAEIKKILKCDMCLERRSEGMASACSEMCPAEAIFFGTLEEVEKELRERVSGEP